MQISEIPRGQLSTIILSSLLDGDKYGYEIIESIEKRTSGEIVIKKPSLYSTLTRLEKQDLVSSYWKDSNIGGRRHYYRLTDFGKKQVLQWQEQLYSSQNKLAQILQNNLVDEKPTLQKSFLPENKAFDKKINITDVKEDKSEEIFLKQENLFKLAKEKQLSEKTQNAFDQDKEKIISQENLENNYIQYDLFSTSSFIVEPDNFTNVENKNIDLKNQNELTMESEDNSEKNNEEKTNSLTTKEKDFEQKSNLFKQNINEILNKETADFEERLQKAKKSFNFESEYRKHLKTTKSFAETFSKEELVSATPFSIEKDIISSPDIKAMSFNQYNSNESVNEPSFKKAYNQFEEKLQNLNEENYESDLSKKSNDLFVDSKSEVYSHKVQDFSFESLEEKNEKPENIEKPLEKKNEDAVFIKDKLEPAPKVKKILPASFLHLNKNQLTSPTRNAQNTQKEEFETVKEPQIKDTTQEETFGNSFSSAKKYFDNFKVKVSEYKSQSVIKTAKNFKASEKSDFVNLKKFNFIFAFINFSVLILQIIAMLIILTVKKIDYLSNLWLVYVLIGVFIFWTGYNGILYLKDKNTKILKQKVLLTPLWQKLILISIFLLLIYSISLILGIDTNNVSDFALALSLPIFVCVNALVSHFIKISYIK